jgi:hypothetical protein
MLLGGFFVQAGPPAEEEEEEEEEDPPASDPESDPASVPPELDEEEEEEDEEEVDDEDEEEEEDEDVVAPSLPASSPPDDDPLGFGTGIGVAGGSDSEGCFGSVAVAPLVTSTPDPPFAHATTVATIPIAAVPPIQRTTRSSMAPRLTWPSCRRDRSAPS